MTLNAIKQQEEALRPDTKLFMLKTIIEKRITNTMRRIEGFVNNYNKEQDPALKEHYYQCGLFQQGILEELQYMNSCLNIDDLLEIRFEHAGGKIS